MVAVKQRAIFTNLQAFSLCRKERCLVSTFRSAASFGWLSESVRCRKRNGGGINKCAGKLANISLEIVKERPPFDQPLATALKPFAITVERLT